jgi:transcriptional regulator GlxA family with amidase domain
MPLSIADIARQVDVSPFHFIRQFEALFGATPHQFRIRSRLEHASSGASGLMTNWRGGVPRRSRDN